MPFAPEFALRTETLPLDVDVPSPATRLIAPPVCTALLPDATCTDPPAPDVPLPAVT
jgi:hypothetical protein